jgi:hypothetical protein
MHFLVITKKIYHQKGIKLHYFLKKNLMNNTGYFLFDLTQILISIKFETEIVLF